MILLLILLYPQDAYEKFKAVAISKLEPGTLPYILALILGALYYVFGIRDFFIKDSLEDIHANIKDKLLEPFRGDTELSSKLDKLKKGRTMLHIFYDLIDNNPSLTEKAKCVYMNGLIWTSIVDSIAISLSGIFLYLISFLATFNFYYFSICLILTFIYLFSKLVLLPRITQRHKNLADDQIEFIHLHLEDLLIQKVRQVNV